MNMYIPRPILVEARTHDGSEKAAASLADWIADHGQEYDPQVLPESSTPDSKYLVEFSTESGFEHVNFDEYVIFQNGDFDIFTKAEFNDRYQKVSE